MNLQSWSQKIPDASKRFKLVLDGSAILDKETGLVWEKSPDTTPDTTPTSWLGAMYNAYNKNVGGRRGWRLPTVEELGSLIEPIQNSPPLPSDLALPSGHPFTNVLSKGYWSSTTAVDNVSAAFFMDFNSGFAGSDEKVVDFYYWCVRGGHGYDACSIT